MNTQCLAVRARLAIAGLAIASALSPSPGSAQTSGSAPPPPASSAPSVDGMRIPAFVYPDSTLVSEEHKRAYARSRAIPGDGSIQVPKDPSFVAKMRTIVNGMFAKSLPVAEKLYPVEMTNATIGGVEVIRVTPKGGVKSANRRRVLLNLHGGSFMVGWPSVALLDAIPIAALSGIEVITIHYRLYPEAVHPAALEDLTSVYREVLKTHSARNVGIFGGSAGGVVTLQSIPWFRTHGLPRPGAIAPLSCGFQTGVGDSQIWNFTGGFVAPGTRLVSSGGYLGSSDRRDWVPGTSPDQLPFYPPTLWLSGTRAPEMSGAITGNARMLTNGVESELYMIEGGWHTSYSTAPETQESQDAMRYIARFFDRRLGR